MLSHVKQFKLQTKFILQTPKFKLYPVLHFVQILGVEQIKQPVGQLII